MSDHYILQGHEPVACDLMTWARWLESHDADRTVGQTTVGLYFISTVFLGLNHNFGFGGPPLLFETMIFYKPGDLSRRCLPDESLDQWMERSACLDPDPAGLDDWQERYSTWDEAAAGHERAARMVEERTGAVRTA